MSDYDALDPSDPLFPGDSAPQPPSHPVTEPPPHLIPPARPQFQSHINWLPGEPGSAKLDIRSCGPADVRQARSILGASGYGLTPYSLVRASQSYGWAFRGVVRNSHHLTAVSLSRHGPRYNHITAFGVAGGWISRASFAAQVVPSLIRTCQQEIIELPTKFTVSPELLGYLTPILTQLSFHLVDHDGDFCVFYARPLYVTPEPRVSVTGGSASLERQDRAALPHRDFGLLGHS